MVCFFSPLLQLLRAQSVQPSTSNFLTIMSTSCLYWYTPDSHFCRYERMYVLKIISVIMCASLSDDV